jgi:hypothetical protein
VAQAQLERTPEFPEEIGYLIAWAYQLVGRSGIGFSGVAPLSFSQIKDWADLMDIGELHPLEIEALLLFDAAITYEQEPAGKEDSILPKQRPKWPSPREVT